MGWGSAIKRVAPPAVIVPREKPPAYPRADPATAVWTSDDLALVERYYKALIQLAAENRIYRPNRVTFGRWDVGQRLKWIYAIEQQAADGLETIGAVVVTRVVMNRLGD